MKEQPVENKILTLKKAFEARFGSSEGLRFFAAPGRVTLIGEHIDYCGGRVVRAALTLDTLVAIRKNGTPSTVRLAATTIDGIRTFDINNIEDARSLDWGNYQAGVVRELIRLAIDVGGFDACYLTTVPFGAGLSSSASIEVSTGLAVSELFGGKLSGVEIALAGQRAENTFCGVNCGIMDQFASAMRTKDHASVLDCTTLDYKYVPPDLGNHVIILANTCKKHALGASKYNERRREVAEGLEEMQRIEKSRGIKEPHKTLCEYSVEELRDYMCEISDPTVMMRVIHVVTENARVKEAVKVLEAGKLDEFGELLRKANNSIRYLYEATGSELDAMFDAAVTFDGCVGARMTGGGFGGCTVNIVAADRVEEFKEYVGTRYTAATGNVPEFYVCETGDGARELFI